MCVLAGDFRCEDRFLFLRSKVGIVFNWKGTVNIVLNRDTDTHGQYNIGSVYVLNSFNYNNTNLLLTVSVSIRK
jgi:hypothetical protein